MQRFRKLSDDIRYNFLETLQKEKYNQSNHLIYINSVARGTLTCR